MTDTDIDDRTGGPGTWGYNSHSVPHREMQPDEIKTVEALLAPPAKTPVLSAMQGWLNGERVLSLKEQFAQFGYGYRDHLAEMFDEDGKIRRKKWRDYFQDSMQAFKERELFVGMFGFAVPSSEAIELLLAHSPLVEIGAGSGAWSKLLLDRGADVIVTDPMLEKFFQFEHGRYAPVLPLQGKTAVRRWPDRNVFCSWPSLGGTWLRQAARAMRPGRTLLVVREEACAEDTTWEYIHSAFRPIAHHELLGWHYLHDRFEGWVKLGPKQRREKSFE